MVKSVQGISVGVGGWGYLPVKQTNKLSLCAKLYDFVEVNSTFYKLPDEKLARKWRASVPEKFQFSVRANHKLTHEQHLEPIEENFLEYERNLSICKILQAFVLHFQFPPSFEVTTQIVQGWRSFFSSVKKEAGLKYSIEVRNRNSLKNSLLQSFLMEYDIIPTSDPSRDKIQISAYSKIQYSRVLGLGDHTKWSFSTGELVQLKEKVSKTPATRRYVTFHNITMYEDGARLKQMLDQEGNELLAPVTGIGSLKQALVAEKLQYPISSHDLSSKLAWRTVVIEDGLRIHANEITDRLSPNIQFESTEHILTACERLFP